MPPRDSGTRSTRSSEHETRHAPFERIPLLLVHSLRYHFERNACGVYMYLSCIHIIIILVQKYPSPRTLIKTRVLCLQRREHNNYGHRGILTNLKRKALARAGWVDR